MSNEPHLHAQPRTSEVAAAAAVAGQIVALKTGILAWAKRAGEHGLTPDEYSAETGALINTVRRRFTDIWKAGQLRPTELTRKNRRGNPETVWVLGEDPNVRRRQAKPVEANVIAFGAIGTFGPKQTMRVTIELAREDWERVPSPARVRFI